MTRSTLRAIILVTGLITALVHLVLLNVVMGTIDPLFTLNGLGYLGLLAALFLDLPVVSKQRTLVHWAFMAFVGWAPHPVVSPMMVALFRFFIL